MGDWISDLLIFSAGVTGGVLVNLIRPYFSMAKQQRTALVVARARILSDIKNKHEEEILDEAFRTTEAIRGELDKSLLAGDQGVGRIDDRSIHRPAQQRAHPLALVTDLHDRYVF